MILEFIGRQAIGGLIGAGAVHLGRSAAEHLLPRLFADPPRDVGRLATEITNELRAEYGTQGERLAAIESSLRAILENHAPDVDRLAALNLDPDRVVEWLLERGTDCLVGLDDAEQALLRDVLRRAYGALLRDPEKLPGLQRAVFRALLEQHERIAALPQESVAAFRAYEANLLLESGRRVLGRIRSDSVLLRAEYAIVPFHPARQPDLERLCAWCENEAKERVLLLHGAGGLGKTRLAIALVDGMRGRGWQAGFLDRRMDDARLLPGAFQELLHGERPLLIIIDYAETRRSSVRRLLEAAPRHSRPNLRILFLARAAGDWWETMKRGNADIREFMSGARELALAPIEDDAATRAAMFEAARDAFAERLGIVPPASGPPEWSDPDFGKPLYLHMAALAAVRGQAVGDAGKLLGWVLARERDAWDANLEEFELSPDVYRPLLARSATLSVLWGDAYAPSDLRAIVETVPEAEGVDGEKRGAIARLLARLYPETPGLGALRPDILGEELVAKELAEDPDLLRAAFARAVPEERIRHAFTVLGRLAGRREDTACHLDAALDLDPPRLAPHALEVAKELGAPVAAALQRLWDRLDAGARFNLATTLITRLPDQTANLRRFCADVAEHLYYAERLKGRNADRVRLADFASHFAIFLSKLGRPEEAVEKAAEAMNIYRRLAVGNPDAFRPRLGLALTNLASRLCELGQREQALKNAEEATDVYRQLADENPGVFMPDFAMILNNVGTVLRELGRHREALQFLEKSVNICYEVIDINVSTHRPRLALSLYNLAIRLGELGRFREALEKAAEAVRLCRQLAERNPDAYKPWLAMVLTSLASRLGALGQHEQALAIAAEAAAIRRRLAKESPDAFKPDFAMSLGTLAICFSKAGRHEEALHAAEEAMEIYRHLENKYPGSHGPDLARSLSNTAICLIELRRAHEALRLCREAIQLYQELAEKNAVAFEHDVARSLAIAAACLNELGQRENALVRAEEALHLLRPHFLDLPEAHGNLIISITQQYQSLCQSLGREPDRELLAPILEKLAELEAGGSDRQPDAPA